MTPSVEQRLRAVEPAVRLVRERTLRKVVHALRVAGWVIPRNPHCPLVAFNADLRQHTIWTEPDDDSEPGLRILLTEPTDRYPENPPDDEVLRRYWQLLVQVRVAVEFQTQFDTNRAQPEAVLAVLAPDMETEARFVLEADHLIEPGSADSAFVAQFLGLYVAMAWFQPERIPVVFPSAPDAAPGLQRLQPWLDVASVVARLKPEGTSDSDVPFVNPSQHTDLTAHQPPIRSSTRGHLLRQAERAVLRENFVRAAILRVQAGSSAWPILRDELIPRLRRVLDWDEVTTEAWTRALGSLLKPAAQGTWPRAARFLYELQKLSTNLTGELSIIDPIEWARTLGRRPLTRPLTRARSVILLQHLKKAHRQLVRAQLVPTDQDRVMNLLEAEQARWEERIRRDLTPVIMTVLARVGYEPTNLPERVARDKLVAELLDVICSRGYLRLGDLRDAIARNQLKLTDLSGPGEWLGGDALLRADMELTLELDGIYHRGELYLRGIQRGTALAFGTRPGRWFTKFLAVPFGGAFLAVEFGLYVVHEIQTWSAKIRSWFPQDEDDAPVLPSVPEWSIEISGPPVPAVAEVVSTPAIAGISISTIGLTLALGVVILGLIHWPTFRMLAWRCVSGMGSVFRTLFVIWPVAVWKSDIVRAIRTNSWVRLGADRIGYSVLLTLGIVVLLLALGSGPRRVMRWSCVTFLISVILLNTPWGRRVEDDLAEALSDLWRQVRVNLIPGFVSWVVEAFRSLVGWFEQCLYSVDEWFRYREGQSNPSFALKLILALAWFPIAYLTRLVFCLLLEPQINPVKHFPVVTVSHKLIWPLVPQVASWTGLSAWTVSMVINAIPGVFGFIAWELKENWRLYAANRPRRLGTVVLGHHGETMRGLLSPGFHSGTIPKHYRKLRSYFPSERGAIRTDGFVKEQQALNRTAHAIQVFLQRDLLPLIHATKSWQVLRLEVAIVAIRPQSILVELVIANDPTARLQLRTFRQADQLLTTVESRGLVERLDPDQLEALRVALSGYAAMTGSRCKDCDYPRDWPDWVSFWDKSSDLSKN